MLRANDPEMIGTLPQPVNNTAAACSSWTKAEAKGKGTIVLSHGHVAKARCLDFITVESSEDSIELELQSIFSFEYTAVYAQAIHNIRNKLYNLRYIDGKNWGSHIEKDNGLTAKREN